MTLLVISTPQFKENVQATWVIGQEVEELASELAFGNIIYAGGVTQLNQVCSSSAKRLDAQFRSYKSVTDCVEQLGNNETLSKQTSAIILWRVGELYKMQMYETELRKIGINNIRVYGSII